MFVRAKLNSYGAKKWDLPEGTVLYGIKTSLQGVERINLYRDWPMTGDSMVVPASPKEVEIECEADFEKIFNTKSFGGW